jgi:putative transposase
MVYHPDRHHRRSIRLKNYDYSTEGAYFITICIQHRQPLLGDIQNGEMQPNFAGQMVQQVWDELRSHYPGIDLDAFTLMPNHIHGVLLLFAPPNGSTTLILGDVIHRFKSLTTAKYRQGIYQQNWQPFISKLWQRNYYEHIIRDDDSLECIRNYIAQNPKFWRCDRLHPNQPKLQRAHHQRHN